MANNTPKTGLSLMPEEAFYRATRPLFDDEGCVAVVEWSFDAGWGRELPPWLLRLLQQYSQDNALLGHGVSYSPLDASCTPRQASWLERLRAELCTYRYRHISEHFGFMGGGNFHLGAPLPVPLTPEAIEVGQQRLAELSQVSQLPVGLENLAFAFNVEEAQTQGEFLETLLQPTDGFLLLDLHNIYCQLCNFQVSADELLSTYPLDRVREIHVSGGSWSEDTNGESLRRDTHDDSVPQAVFDLVSQVIPRCPNLEFVLLERLGDTISPDDDEQLRADFQQLTKTVNLAA